MNLNKLDIAILLMCLVQSTLLITLTVLIKKNQNDREKLIRYNQFAFQGLTWSIVFQSIIGNYLPFPTTMMMAGLCYYMHWNFFRNPANPSKVGTT